MKDVNKFLFNKFRLFEQGICFKKIAYVDNLT